MNQASHIAIIMDGNGRWAEDKNLKRIKGHEVGAEVVRKITEFCAANDEIERLIRSELSTYLKNNIRFEPIGDIRAFSKSLQNVIKDVQDKTAHCDGLVQSLALNYGARDEMLRAINNIRNYEGDITDEMLSNALDCNHNVDLLIRTGGDHRLSNYLLWQSSYAEIFFIDTLWPDFTKNELEKIIKNFKKIERRFGGLK